MPLVAPLFLATARNSPFTIRTNIVPIPLSHPTVNMAAEFNPDFGMDANGMSTAPADNKTLWTAETYRTFAAVQEAFWKGRAAQNDALVPVPAPVQAAAATTAFSSGEAALALIESLRATYAAAFSAPASTGGSRPEQHSTALFLSNVVKNINPK